MRPAGLIARNAAALTLSQLAIKAVNLVVSVLTVRWLGARELGRYAYIVAFSFPFGALGEFGLGTLSIREISRDPQQEGVILATVSRLLLVLTTFSVTGMLVFAVLTRHDGRMMAGLAVVGLSALLSSLASPLLILLTAREQMHLLSLYRIVATAVGASSTLVVLMAGGQVLALLLAQAGTNVVMLGLACFLTERFPLAGTTTVSAALRLLRQAIPFALLMIAYAVYYRVDMVMLEWMRGPREVGLYAAAYRFLDTIILFAASMGTPFFPRLSHLAGTNPPEVRQLLERTWRPLLALGLPLSVGTSLLAEQLVSVLFGSEFAQAAGLLQVLIWATLPLFWINIANHSLNAADRVWALMVIYGLSAGVNILGNLLLIPRFGSFGASLATLLCEWMNLLLALRLIRRDFAVRLNGDGLWRYALATLGLAVTVWLARDAGLAPSILLGGITYVGVLLLLGYSRSADMLDVKHLLTQ